MWSVGAQWICALWSVVKILDRPLVGDTARGLSFDRGYASTIDGISVYVISLCDN